MDRDRTSEIRDRGRPADSISDRETARCFGFPFSLWGENPRSPKAPPPLTPSIPPIRCGDNRRWQNGRGGATMVAPVESSRIYARTNRV
jgi:hypothetical protein